MILWWQEGYYQFTLLLEYRKAWMERNGGSTTVLYSASAPSTSLSLQSTCFSPRRIPRSASPKLGIFRLDWLVEFSLSTPFHGQALRVAQGQTSRWGLESPFFLFTMRRFACSASKTTPAYPGANAGPAAMCVTLRTEHYCIRGRARGMLHCRKGVRSSWPRFWLSRIWGYKHDITSPKHLHECRKSVLVKSQLILYYQYEPPLAAGNNSSILSCRGQLGSQMIWAIPVATPL